MIDPKKYGKIRKTVLETIRICMDQRIGSKYLERRELKALCWMNEKTGSCRIMDAMTSQFFVKATRATVHWKFSRVKR